MASTETKNRDAEGDGEAEVFKEVPQVASLPTPTTEAAPPASEDDGCTLWIRRAQNNCRVPRVEVGVGGAWVEGIGR